MMTRSSRICLPGLGRRPIFEPRVGRVMDEQILLFAWVALAAKYVKYAGVCGVAGWSLRVVKLVDGGRCDPWEVGGVIEGSGRGVGEGAGESERSGSGDGEEGVGE